VTYELAVRLIDARNALPFAQIRRWAEHPAVMRFVGMHATKKVCLALLSTAELVGAPMMPLNWRGIGRLDPFISATIPTNIRTSYVHWMNEKGPK